MTHCQCRKCGTALNSQSLETTCLLIAGLTHTPRAESGCTATEGHADISACSLTRQPGGMANGHAAIPRLPCHDAAR